MAMCDPGMSFADYMTNFQFVEGVTCVYADVTGFLVLGLIVYTGVAGVSYIRTGSMVMPFILMLLIGGAVISQMASISLAYVVVLMLLIPAGLVAYLYFKFAR